MKRRFWKNFFEGFQFGFGMSFGIIGIFGMISNINSNGLLFIMSAISFGVGLALLKDFLVQDLGGDKIENENKI